MALPQEETIATLLAPDEPAPYEIIEHEGHWPLVLVCDHASNRVPACLGDLGVSAEDLRDHIAWDPGAGPITRYLSDRLQVSAVLGNYSRLVVDLNRDLEDPTAFPQISDGVLVPANLGLSVEARAERARALFKPYHEAIRRVIQGAAAAGRQPVFIGVHSFTPYLHGVFRPWQIGVLWDKDARLPIPLLAALRSRGDIVVGDNEPYSGRHPADFTVDHHAEPLGLAHAGLEIRQDLLRDSGAVARWGERLAEVLEVVLEEEGLYSGVG